ncbi:MAG: hypothetical protein AAF685_11760, partial [Cyanobacteria bacterium P01_C01_bin.89]
MTTSRRKSSSVLFPKISAKAITLAPGLLCLCLLSYPLLKVVSSSFDANYLEVVEKREPKRFPKRTYFSAWLRKRNYRQLSDFIDDRLPFRGLAIQTKQVFAENILGESRFTAVDMGKNGWLYYRLSYGLEETGDGNLIDGERVEYALNNLQYFLQWQTAQRRKVRVMAVPNKHTIYPEYLSRQARDDLEKSQPGRKTLYEKFGESQDKRLIDLWDAHESAKKKSPEKLLYFPEDTHHSSWGSIVLMRSLVQSLSSDLWNPKDIKVHGGYGNWGLDLKHILGYAAFESEQELPLFYLERSGVETERILVGDREFSSLAEAEDKGLLGDRDSILSFLQNSNGVPLIPGRTLVIRDSFLEVSQQKSLSQYFQSVDYIHA